MFNPYAEVETIDKAIRRTQIRLATLHDEIEMKEKKRGAGKATKIDLKREGEILKRLVAIRKNIKVPKGKKVA